MWFQTLTGFSEQNPDQVRSNLIVQGAKMTSLKNGREMACGNLETLTLADPRSRLESGNLKQGAMTFSEIAPPCHANLLLRAARRLFAPSS